MSAHVLFTFLNELGGKGIKLEACRAYFGFFESSLTNSITLEHKCKILFIIRRNYILLSRYWCTNVKILPYKRHCY